MPEMSDLCYLGKTRLTLQIFCSHLIQFKEREMMILNKSGKMQPEQIKWKHEKSDLVFGKK